MLQTFSLDGNGRQVDAAASFFRYEAGGAGGASEEIRVTADGNDLGTYLPGDAVRLPVVAKRWVLTPASSALIAKVRLGIGSVESARLVGTVRVVDEGAAKTLAGLQFMSALTRPGTAAKVCIVGLLAGSRSLAVKRYLVGSATAQDVGLYFSTAAPTDSPSSAGFIASKLQGAALGSAVRWSGLAVARPPTGVELPGVLTLGVIKVPTNDTREFPITTPLVLPPGAGLFAVGSVVNTDLLMNVDAEEL